MNKYITIFLLAKLAEKIIDDGIQYYEEKEKDTQFKPVYGLDDLLIIGLIKNIPIINKYIKE